MLSNSTNPLTGLPLPKSWSTGIVEQKWTISGWSANRKLSPDALHGGFVLGAWGKTVPLPASSLLILWGW